MGYKNLFAFLIDDDVNLYRIRSYETGYKHYSNDSCTSISHIQEADDIY
jgi:hypothetical protein